MLNVSVGSSSKSSDTVGRISTLEMVIVTMELGEGLLKDGTPDRAILSNSGEGGVLVVLVIGKPIINDDCVRDSQIVHVDGIDTFLVDCIFIEEHAFNSVFELSESSNTGHKPAVANITLFDVVDTDTILTEERIISGRELIFGSLPDNPLLDISGDFTFVLSLVCPI